MNKENKNNTARPVTLSGIKQAAEFLRRYAAENNFNDELYIAGDSRVILKINGKEELKIEILFKLPPPYVEEKNSCVGWDDKTAAPVIDRIFLFESNPKEETKTETSKLEFTPDCGFRVEIETRSKNYVNLAIAYKVSRELLKSYKSPLIWDGILKKFLNGYMENIKEGIELQNIYETIEENRNFFKKQIDKNRFRVKLSSKYLKKLLKAGRLFESDLLSLYSSRGLR